MTTPIRPSLAQMLNPQAAPVRPVAQPPEQAGGFAAAMSAQRAFFQQAQPKITPATYTAEQITQSTRQPAPPAAAQDSTQPLKRPGSYLNIVV